MARIIRIACSFAIVAVAYWAYAVFAVPLIEPTVQRAESNRLSEEERQSVQREYSRRREALEGLFPAGSWPLDSAKILASDPLRLLFQEYRNLGNGKVEIRPCAIIYTPGGPASDKAERKRQSVILEAPEGALLEFDQPFDLSRVKVGRLVSGRLKGRIIIRSDGKRPGPEDDLLVVTRDVQMAGNRVWTSHAVEFRLGANHGRGDQMLIRLLPGEEVPGADRHGPNIAGIESFEVRRLERLHMEFGDRGIRPDDGSSWRGHPPPVDPDLPIEISCRGPFRFDLVRQVATFEDCVDVLRIHADGPSDQVNCDFLSLYLARPRTAVANLSKEGADRQASPRPAALDLRPRRIEALGNPVVVTAPSQQVEVRGQRLEYDFASGRIVLDGSKEVFLRQGNNEIHARSLQYESAGRGRLGRVLARGPGWVRAEMDDQSRRQLQAGWNGQLQVRPDEGRQAISLSGGAALNLGGLGHLRAGEIHFWLFEVESPTAEKGDQPRLEPDRMMALHEVRLNSPQLSGEVQQLKVWFVREERPAGPIAAPAAATARGESNPGEAGSIDRLAADFEGKGRTVRPLASASPFAVPGPSHQELPRQHFEIVGNVLEAQVLMKEEGASELTDLVVTGDVCLTETRTARPDELPVVVRGERIEVVNASRSDAVVGVTGQQARFEGRGLALSGSNINLDRGSNLLWIDGAGHMDLRLDRDLDGRPLREPTSLDIDWQERMAFDGRTARFEGLVEASSRHQHLETRTLDVVLKEPIRFDQDPGSGPEPQVEEIRCQGGVFMDSRSFDEQGQTSLDRMRVGELEINLISGRTAAAGPGWMTTVRRDSPDLPGAPVGPEAVDAAASNEDDGKGLTYLNVRFQGSIDGNLRLREITFHDHVRATYGRVEFWDATLEPDNPDALGPGGVLLRCNELTVTQMPSPTGDRDALELVAEDNVQVDGETFNARAARMTYAEAKGLLILEGNGRTDAELYRQEHVGAAYDETTAQRILYWPATKRWRVEGAKSFELNRVPAGKAGS